MRLASFIAELRKQHENEEGITLLELMVTLVIIGILSVLAAQVYADQQRLAGQASLKNDLKNAATVMVTESALLNGRYPDVLPATVSLSKGNMLYISASDGNTVPNNRFTDGVTGWSSVTATGSTPPVGGSMRLERRDHKTNTNYLTVRPGDRIEIIATAKQIKGTLTLNAGIWQNGAPSNCGPYLTYPALSTAQVLATYPDGWVTYRNVITVPSRYGDTISGTCVNKDIPATISVAPFFQINQGTVSSPP
jgi:prepilin-type N-terminal cleavage/methylation domain-containing protein